MKRLAFVLAAAVLGTGCIVTDHDNFDQGSVNVYWDFVRTAPAQVGGILVYDDSDVGTPDGACDESGVEVVTVDSPAGQVTVDCVFGGVEGVAIDFIGEGTRAFRIRGWRGDVLVYDETFNLLVRGNATTDHFVDVHGVAAPLDLFAFLAFGTPPNEVDYPTCGAATPAGSLSPPNIDFEVKDVFGDVVIRDVVGCGLPGDPLPAPVFVGDLDLDNYTVRMRGLRVEDQAVVFDSCDVPLDHFAAQTGAGGFAPMLLTQPVPTCPAI